MRVLLCGWGLALLAIQAGAARPNAVRCEQVALALDPRVTPEVIARDWGTGEPHAEANAALELRGCKDELLDRLELAGPLATLDPTPLRGTVVPTWLVSADLTAPAGSTSGPLTLPVEVVSHRLRVARARGPAGALEPIHLAATGKAAWQRLAVGRADDLLSVSSRPAAGRFVTTYRRYHAGPHGWTIRERRVDEAWEADGDFPEQRRFP